jgi:hypothetical protein
MSRKVHKKEIIVHGYPVQGHEEDYFKTIYGYGPNIISHLSMSDLLYRVGKTEKYGTNLDDAFDAEGTEPTDNCARYYYEMLENDRNHVRETLKHAYPKIYKVKFNVEITEYTPEECKKLWQGRNKQYKKQMQRIKKEKEQDACK